MNAVTALAGGMLRPLAMTAGRRDATAAARSDADFDTLYRQQARRVQQTCRYLLGSADEAEDAAQEVFLRARQRFEQYDRERPFASWILGVASHHCIDRLRRRGRGRETRSTNRASRRTWWFCTPALPRPVTPGGGWRR